MERIMNFFNNIVKGDKVIWVVFISLCLISLVEVFSASSTLTYKSGNHLGPIAGHSLFLMAGVLLVVLLHHIPYKWFQALPLILLPFSGLFLILLLMFDSLNLGGILVIEKINEAGRWVRLFGIQFQPSEFAKMGVVIVTAFTLARGQTEEGASPKAFKIIMWIAGLICLFILPENSSTAMLLAGTVFIMMIIGRIQTRKLVMLAGTAATVVVLFVSFLLVTPNKTLESIPKGHRFTTWKSRIMDFAGGEEIPAAKFNINEDGQVAHARIAIASSGVLGKGPGNSVQRDFLSQAFSDFIYAIIIEELGLVGGCAVVLLYIILLVRIGRIANKCDRTFPAFLIIGIGVLLGIQALFNMMVAVGLAPVTGQPLPLISRGGTSTVINCVYIGMILSVSRYTAALEEQRLHDALIPMEVAGAEELMEPVVTEAQTAIEPTAKAMNSDSEFE